MNMGEYGYISEKNFRKIYRNLGIYAKYGIQRKSP